MKNVFKTRILWAVLIFIVVATSGCAGSNDQGKTDNAVKTDNAAKSDTVEKEKSSPRKATFVTGAVGSDSNRQAIAINNLLKKYTDIELTIVPVGGSAESMAIVGQGEGDFTFIDGLNMATVLYKGDHKALYLKPAELNNLRGMLNFIFGGSQVVVKADSGIKNMKDLKNKRISVGVPGSQAARLGTQILEANGLGEKDYKMAQIALNEAVDSLRDGKIDAMMILAGGPYPQLMELSVKTPLYVVPIEDEAIKALNEKSPGWTKGYFPADMYKGQANEGKVSSAFGVNYIGANRETDPKIVKDVLDVFFAHLDEFHNMAGGAGSFISFEDALLNPVPTPFPLHDGAYDYYKEKASNIPKNMMPVKGDFYKP